MSGFLKLAGVLLAMAGWAVFGNATADADQEQAVKKGEAHYLFFCAHCHGAQADGNGPYSRLLKIAPTDLRSLRQSGDESVTERVLKAVDGRHNVGEGEQKDMPVFSDNLEVKTVYEISEYLKTVQN
jgi:mono/diheme cytochrome c family protein